MNASSDSPSKPAADRPVRVLHVLGQLRRGGVETWLMHVLRHIDRERFAMDFLVHASAPGQYDAEAQRLGSQILHCPAPRRPWRYARRFRMLLQEHGPYDVVHSHVYHYSGLVLRLAQQAGVPRRIAHSHTAQDAGGGQTISPLRELYWRLARQWIHRYATRGLACSRDAARSLFGNAWQSDPRWQTLPYGVDFEPFEQPVDRPAVRGEVGIPDDALVVGHVGTFSAVKNHAFFIQVAEQIRQRRDDAWFLLVGDGPLRGEIESEVARRGLADRFVFAGSRDDVPRVLRGAMDAFLFPSLYEGLGLVLVEAQAAGLPAVYSDRVPAEAAVVEELLCPLSLSQPASEWAERLLGLLDARSDKYRQAALERLKQSDFDMAQCIDRLEKLYTH